MHARTAIRKAFVEALKGNTAAGNHIYDSRLYTLEEAILPAIIVFSSNEEVNTSTISPPRLQERKVKITVECYAKATEDVNVVTDQLAAEVEQAIAADINLKKLCKDCRLESTDISLNSDGDRPVAVGSLIFSVSYITRENNSEIIIWK